MIVRAGILNGRTRVALGHGRQFARVDVVAVDRLDERLFEFGRAFDELPVGVVVVDVYEHFVRTFAARRVRIVRVHGVAKFIVRSVGVHAERALARGRLEGTLKSAQFAAVEWCKAIYFIVVVGD